MNNIIYIQDPENNIKLSNKGLTSFNIGIASKTWEYWCNKNNCKLIFELPKNLKDIDKIAFVSSNVFIHWQCPNFFDLVNSIGVVRDTDDFGKIYDKIKNTELFVGDYINTDFN